MDHLVTIGPVKRMTAEQLDQKLLGFLKHGEEDLV